MITRYQSVVLPLALGILALAAFVVGGCSRSPKTEAKVKSNNERKAAPAFSLKDDTGANISLADYKGKVVLLNFWATWCGPCEVEIPWFIEFQQKYQARDFAVLGVSMDDDGWKSVTPYLKAHKINYRVTVGDEKLSQLYGSIDSLPTSFVLDREGRIAAQHVGLVDKREYQNEILKLLDDPKQSAASHASAVGQFAAFMRPVWASR